MAYSQVSKLDGYFEDYAAYHRTRGNQITHAFGIPMIAIAVLGWSSGWVWLKSTSTELPGSLVQFDFAEVIMIAVSIWYLLLDWRKGLPFVFILLGFYWLGRSCSNGLLWGLLIVGWVLQLVGHGVYEKKSPAFTKNALHVLIGPIWVFTKQLHL